MWPVWGGLSITISTISVINIGHLVVLSLLVLKLPFQADMLSILDTLSILSTIITTPLLLLNNSKVLSRVVLNLQIIVLLEIGRASCRERVF